MGFNFSNISELKNRAAELADAVEALQYQLDLIASNHKVMEPAEWESLRQSMVMGKHEAISTFGLLNRDLELLLSGGE